MNDWCLESAMSALGAELTSAIGSKPPRPQLAQSRRTVSPLGTSKTPNEFFVTGVCVWSLHHIGVIREILMQDAGDRVGFEDCQPVLKGRAAVCVVVAD